MIVLCKRHKEKQKYNYRVYKIKKKGGKCSICKGTSLDESFLDEPAEEVYTLSKEGKDLLKNLDYFQKKIWELEF